MECDINDLISLKEKLSSDYDTFYHFAWDGTYGDSRNDALLQEQNIHNTLIAVEVAHALGCKVLLEPALRQNLDLWKVNYQIIFLKIQLPDMVLQNIRQAD